MSPRRATPDCATDLTVLSDRSETHVISRRHRGGLKRSTEVTNRNQCRKIPDCQSLSVCDVARTAPRRLRRKVGKNATKEPIAAHVEGDGIMYVNTIAMRGLSQALSLTTRSPVTLATT